MTVQPEDEIVRYMKEECHYPVVKALPDGRYAAIYPLLYTHAIVTVSRDSYRLSYDDRWCYKDFETCNAALEAWDGTGEPQGWHRHPQTGRRRTESGEEYVAW